MDRRTPNKFKFVQSGRQNGRLAANMVANGCRATVEGGARAMAKGERWPKVSGGGDL